jgi:hypothetical protein
MGFNLGLKGLIIDIMFLYIDLHSYDVVGMTKTYKIEL